jgi:predicted phage baseplate assembly protein
VPEAGRSIRFSQYRHGGGGAGNVPAGKIQVLKSAIPYIDRVINLRRAEGGRDQESLDEAKMRAARELRAQQRAVTAEDYENLAKKASRAVARVKCRAPGRADKALPPGMLELLIVPAAFDALQAGDVSKLQIDQALRQTVVNYLDRYRLLTTTLRVREPTYMGVQVCAQIVPGEYSQPDVVRTRVIDSLKNFITPLALGGSEEADWEGWPFGRDLYVAEIYSLIQKVPGVKHVLEVRLNQREVFPSKEPSARGEEDRPEAAAEGALIPVTERRLEVPDDTLLCSLDHQVEIVDL